MSLVGILAPPNDPALIEARSRFANHHEVQSRPEESVLMAAADQRSRVCVDRSGTMLGVEADGPFAFGRSVDEFAKLLLDGFRNGGSAFVENCRGQFSAAIWESEQRRLLLYRCRIGVPPMFYWPTEGRVAWSTRISHLFDLGAERSVDKVALGHYQLAGFVQSPRTMFSEIKKLPAAHRLEAADAGHTVARYWMPKFRPKLEPRPHQEDSVAVQRILEDSLRHLTQQANRPGLLLSSGIDSVGLAVVAAADLGIDIEAFTFRYLEYQGRFNEAEKARDIAQRLGLSHRTIEVGPSFIAERLPELVRVYEEPFTYGLHSASMGPIRSDGVDLLLTGAEGATWAVSHAREIGMNLGNLIPGPLLSRLHTLTQRLPWTPRKLRTLLAIAASSDPERYLQISQQAILGVESVTAMHADGELINRALRDIVSNLSSVAIGTDNETSADRLALLGLSSFGPEHLLWWTYRWAVFWQLPVRFPLLDFDYIEHMCRQRTRDKNAPERRQMAARYLPTPHAERDKLAQTAPLSEWLRGSLHAWSRSIINQDEIEADGTFRYEVLDRCLSEHKEGTHDHKWCIWTVLCYLVWKRELLHS